jgi:hypothetical protein
MAEAPDWSGIHGTLWTTGIASSGSNGPQQTRSRMVVEHRRRLRRLAIRVSTSIGNTTRTLGVPCQCTSLVSLLDCGGFVLWDWGQLQGALGAGWFGIC